MFGSFVIARSRNQGVVCGYLQSLAGQCGELTEARQIHHWTGANTLFELSLHGADVARISEPVERMLMLEICGVIPCTEKATENLRQSRWNTSYVPLDSPQQTTSSPGTRQRTKSKTAGTN